MLHVLPRFPSRRHLFAPFLVAASLLFIVLPLSAFTFTAHTAGHLYKLNVISKVSPAWNAGSCYDIIVVANGSAYVADNSIDAANASVQTMQPRSTTTSPIGRGDFQGPANCASFDFSQEGPTGVLVVHHQKEGQWHGGGGGGDQLWAGDGDSTVKVFDLATGKLLTNPPIQTGAPSDKRADELDYIPTANQVVVANPDASPPYLTYINANTFKVEFTQKFPNATAGMEQPRFYRGFLYQAIPATTANPGGEIDKIDPRSHTILHVYPTPNCGDSGLIMIGNRAATGCANGPSAIVNLDSGKVTMVHTGTTLVGKGTDMVDADVSLGRFFFADYGSSSMIITDVKGNVLGQIATDGLAHSVAVDQESHRVFIPEGSLGGVAQYVPTGGE
jgi:hypothetical protein